MKLEKSYRGEVKSVVSLNPLNIRTTGEGLVVCAYPNFDERKARHILTIHPREYRTLINKMINDLEVISGIKYQLTVSIK